MSATQPARFAVADIELARQLFGENNGHLKQIAQALKIDIHARGNQVTLEGDPLETKLAGILLEQLYDLLQKGYPLYPRDIDYAIRLLSGDDRI